MSNVEGGASRSSGSRTFRFPRPIWSVLALAAGLAIGLLVHGSVNPWAGRFTAFVAPMGQLWAAALRVTVVPLVVTRTFVAIVQAHHDRSIGALGARAVFLFVLMLVGAALCTLAVAPPLVSLYSVDAATTAALRAGASPLPAASAGNDTSIGAWIGGLIPRNVFQALSSGEILPVLIVSVLFALAVARLKSDRRQPLADLVVALADATMIVVSWILMVAPLGIFALTYDMTLRAGVHVTRFVVAYIVLDSGILLFITALLYPVTALLGRVSITKFARAVLPAQLVAASTRSSLASLPALIEGAEDQLRLPVSATGIVLPLAVSVFRLSRMISSPLRLVLLAHVFGVHLGVAAVVTFIAIEFLASFGTPGVPGGSGGTMGLPAYLAVGIPIEGVLIVQAADTIPDSFKTVVNVTADLSAATLLSRSETALAGE